MAEKPKKPNLVEMNLMKGPNIYIGKEQGKVYSGLVIFNSADPTIPVVWLGQKDYALINLQTKRTILYYDTLSKMLIKPSSLGSSQASADVMPQTMQNFLVGAREAQSTLGIQDRYKQLTTAVIAGMVIIGIVVVLFLYLLATSSNAAALISSHA